jgi:putative glutamine amidotransferase
MKPRIAIPVPNSDPAYSARTLPQYKAAIEAAGGEPIEIPLTLSIAELAQLAKSCDGVLLPGSPADVDPQKYNAARHEKTAAPDPLRDNADELLLQDAHNMRKPLLGICYGLQSLNVWRQGTLVQHIESPVQHTRNKGMFAKRKIEHDAVVEPAARLGHIVAGALATIGSAPITFTVNSSHHQAVEQVGSGLKVVATSPDDHVVEAVENTSPDHWVLGVQWHPERTFQEDAPSRAIFKALVDEARKWHEHLRRTAADFETL